MGSQSESEPPHGESQYAEERAAGLYEDLDEEDDVSTDNHVADDDNDDNAYNFCDSDAAGSLSHFQVHLFCHYSVTIF